MNSSDVAEGSDKLFDGLIAAWKEADYDPPVPDVVNTTPDEEKGPWYLYKIITKNFGGLNTYGGAEFCSELQSENWCLEGSNGSGKTLLTSAIIWSLTGYRLRENDGLMMENGIRTPVYDDSGRKIGAWPALATYPVKRKGLDEHRDRQRRADI